MVWGSWSRDVLSRCNNIWWRSTQALRHHVLMGMAKRAMMDQEAQGWSYTDELVCTSCVDDYALEKAIAEKVKDGEVCSFCGESPAASLDVLMEVFVLGLGHEYNNADNEFIPYESREGGYQFFAGPGYDSWDLVGEYEDVLVGDGLIDAVRSSIHETTWVERDYVWRRRDEVLSDAWASFSDAVKYHTRYVFWLTNDEDEDRERGYGEVPAAKILHDIGILLDALGAVRHLEVGSRFWRAQVHAGRTLFPTPSAGRLGTVPRAFAKVSNRMSPAGIPMFYGALESSTAVSEVIAHASIEPIENCVTVGAFETTQPIMVLDLTSLPSDPSVFDSEIGQYRREVSFLHDFVDALTAPVAEGDELIDYVPTQVVTEYFLRAFTHSTNERVVGVIYPSVAHPGGTAIVLDIQNDRCLEAPDSTGQTALVLDPGSVITESLNSLDACS